MKKELARQLAIFSGRLRSLSFPEMVRLIVTSLFKSQNILIYSRELEDAASLPENQEHDTFISRPNGTFLDEYRAGNPTLPWEFSCDIYDGVKEFFVYKKNGAVGHIGWIYYKDDPNRIIALEDGEAEIKYCLTIERFRGKGLYPATLANMQRYLRNSGLKRVFITVEAENAPSIRGIEKAGFEMAGKIRLVKFFGVQLNKRYSFTRGIPG
jgi:RimJ/RimL family protein N-acetyltransferase